MNRASTLLRKPFALSACLFVLTFCLTLSLLALSARSRAFVDQNGDCVATKYCGKTDDCYICVGGQPINEHPAIYCGKLTPDPVTSVVTCVPTGPKEITNPTPANIGLCLKCDSKTAP